MALTDDTLQLAELPSMTEKSPKQLAAMKRQQQQAEELAKEFGIDFDIDAFMGQQAATTAGLQALQEKYGGLGDEFSAFTAAQQEALKDLQRESARTTALQARRGGSLAKLRGSALETGRKVGKARTAGEAARGAKRRELLDVAASTAGEIRTISEAQANRQAKVNDAVNRASEIINAELGSFYSTPGQRKRAEDRIKQEVLAGVQDPLVVNAVLGQLRELKTKGAAGRLDFGVA